MCLTKLHLAAFYKTWVDPTASQTAASLSNFGSVGSASGNRDFQFGRTDQLLQFVTVSFEADRSRFQRLFALFLMDWLNGRLNDSVCLEALRSCLVLFVGLGSQGVAQQVSMKNVTPQQLAGIAKDNSRHFGDDPDDGGAIATDLSPRLRPEDVGKAMRKVADWQLARSEQYFDRIWTWSVLYSGFMAASDSPGDAKYRDAMEAMGKRYDWQLRSLCRMRTIRVWGRRIWSFI